MEKMKEFYTMNSFDAHAYKDYLHQILEDRSKLSYLSYNLLEGNKIIRTRINENCKIFRNISDISYPPAEYARLDRASLKGKPMFYGSVFTHQNETVYLPRIVNLIETSIFFKDQHSEGRQLLTQSAWKNTRTLRLVILPVSLNYTQPCDEVQDMQKEFYETAKNIGIYVSEEAIFLGDLFASKKELNTYNMTAHLVDYILNESKDAAYFDGVIYPSVPGEGLGMNICIKPSLIDTGIVKCMGASLAMLIKDKMESKLSSLLDCDIADDGELLWHNSEMLDKAFQNPYLFNDLLNLSN